MTREKEIIFNLNVNESRMKNALLAGNMEKYEKWENVQKGALKMLNLLGYRAIEDPTAAEQVNDTWIKCYESIEDIR